MPSEAVDGWRFEVVGGDLTALEDVGYVVTEVSIRDDGLRVELDVDRTAATVPLAVLRRLILEAADRLGLVVTERP